MCSLRRIRGRQTAARLLLAAIACAVVVTGSAAQSCTTQAHMSAEQRAELGSVAYSLASAVQAGDAARVRSSTVTQYAGDLNQTAYLVRTTGERLAGDTLAVTQLDLLDASTRKPGESAEAEFTCPLGGSLSETDFGIAGLPPGKFAFALVEARGSSPWALAFLLEQESGTWKMAGFYPHARAAAGHDGVWYWTAARADAKANKPWLSYVLYGEADQLLRPANFVTSGNLDKLRGERRTAAPEPLTNGLSPQTPLSLTGPNGTVYRVTDLDSQSSDDGKVLNLVLHVQTDGTTTGDAATERSLGAMRALLTAHPELREGFTNIWVIAETGGANPVVVQRPVGEIGSAVAK